MAQDNCAQEAPQGRRAHAPTGFRRLTPGLLKADRTAEGFAGLPEGVTAPGQLLAAFKAAAPHLGIAPRLVHAVDWLFRFTQPQDWEGGQPADRVALGLMQQEALGLSPTQVKAANRPLIELGLVTMKDSPNGKRYGIRDPKGPDYRGLRLRSVAAGYTPCRIRSAGGGGEGRSAAMSRLRRRATIARKAIVQILETAAEYGFEGEEWQALAPDMAALTRALRGVERLNEMELGVTSLERRQKAARERLEQLLGNSGFRPQGARKRPTKYTITKKVFILKRIQ